MLRVIVPLALLAFTVYAVVDCIQTEDDRVRNLPKLAWVVIVLLFTPAGGIAWFLAGRPHGGPARFPRIGPAPDGGAGGLFGRPDLSFQMVLGYVFAGLVYSGVAFLCFVVVRPDRRQEKRQ